MYYLHFKNNTRIPKRDRMLLRKALTQERRDSIMEKKLKAQKGFCFWCGVEIDMAGHLDHIKPVLYGGKSTSGNLVASCRDCNMIKSYDQLIITNQKTIDEYLKIIEIYKKKKDNFYFRRYDKQYRLYKCLHAYAFRKTKAL